MKILLMNEVLVYINPICNNTDGTFEYDFLFSDTPEIVWGADWSVINPSICNNLLPERTTYNSIYRVKTDLPLKTAEETTYYPMEYATYGIIALGWIDISNLDEYPENGRMVFHFGDSKEKTVELLSLYGYEFEN